MSQTLFEFLAAKYAESLQADSVASFIAFAEEYLQQDPLVGLSATEASVPVMHLASGETFPLFSLEERPAEVLPAMDITRPMSSRRLRQPELPFDALDVFEKTKSR